MRFLKCFMLLFLVFNQASATQNNLAICAIFQNEAKWLPEWIDFHRQEGVEHFYLYNNDSTDDFQKVLQPYVEAGIVEIIPWNLKHNNLIYFASQVVAPAYMDCIHRARNKFAWVAFLDTDEFLFSVNRNYTIVDVLPFFKNLAPGVCVNWVMYGTSNVNKINKGESLLDLMVMRSEISYAANRHIKSIVQPNLVLDCKSPHYFFYKQGHAITEIGEIIGHDCFSKNISVNILRINHYWSRDKEWLYGVKLERAKEWGNTNIITTMENQFLNKVYDPILSKKPK